MMAVTDGRAKNGNKGRYYVRGATAPFEEDMLHEFKGHRCLAVEELPPWTQESKTEKASRRAVSRYIKAVYFPFIMQCLALLYKSNTT